MTEQPEPQPEPDSEMVEMRRLLGELNAEKEERERQKAEEEKVSQFCSARSVDAAIARRQLESAGWDAQRAVESFVAEEEERRLAVWTARGGAHKGAIAKTTEGKLGVVTCDPDEED
eukprot:COSAG04_NODE_11425_length_703_cov_1.727869_1_plen_116_part_10